MSDHTILIIDDDLMIRDMLYDFFLEKGFSVIAADNGQSAMETIGNRDFDAAIVDVKLPESDGLSLVRELMSKRPNTPVIVVTGYPTEDIRDEAYRLGAVAFMEKPFKVTRMAATLKKAISAKESVEFTKSRVI